MFVNSKTGWATASIPGVFRTTDGGANWPRLNSSLTSDISRVWFTSEVQGCAIGASHGKRTTIAVIFCTRDGGNTWKIQTRLDQGVCQLLDISFTNAVNGWAVGSCDHDAVILATNDAGSSWNVVYRSSEFTPELRGIRFADERNGWAVGQWAILGTNDGGATWNCQFQNRTAVALNQSAVISPDEAWAVGGWGFLLHTANGGLTWSQWLLPHEMRTGFLWGIGFADRNVGWLCGAKGLILSTVDGGASWRREQSPVDSVLTDIAVTAFRVFLTADQSQLLVRSR